MYKNVQGPHSPLSPLPPFDFQSKTSNVVVKGKYLTPANSQRNIHLRRSFTPHLLNITPPSASPIKPKNNESSMDLSILVIDDNEKTCEFITPEQKAVKQTSGRTFTIGRKTVKKAKKDTFNQLTHSTLSPLLRNFPTPIIPPSPLKPHRLEYSPMSDTPMRTMSLSMSHESKLSNDVLNDSLKVESVLKEIGLEKYIEQFNREEIDLFVFSILDKNDLSELDIDEKDRPVLLDAIKTYSTIFNESFQL